MTACVRGHLSEARMERVRPVLLSNDSQRPSEPLLCGRAKGTSPSHRGPGPPRIGSLGPPCPARLGRLLTVHGQRDSIDKRVEVASVLPVSQGIMAK